MRHRRRATTTLDEALAAITGPVARRRGAPLERLRLVWPQICGSVLAHHTEPLAFQDGLLILGARGSDWREAVFVQRREIVRRIRGFLPGCRGIRLRTLERARAPAKAPPPPPPADPRTAAVEDAGLRRALDGLLAARARSLAP